MNINIDPDNILSATEVSKSMGLSRWGVIRAIHDGRLKAMKLVGRWYVHKEDMREWRDHRKAKEKARLEKKG